MNADQLIAFEDRVAQEFNAGNIRYPVHLQGGLDYAVKMIKAFKDVKPDDWVCCSWRSHWQCLLKGVPEQEVMEAIKQGRSIAMCFPEHKIISSAIAGGIVPIALGLAWALKGSENTVHCWIGDMTAMMGVAMESIRFSSSQELPMRIIVEDNGMSVSTPTSEVIPRFSPIHVDHYNYTNTYPHCGTGTRVNF